MMAPGIAVFIFLRLVLWSPENFLSLESEILSREDYSPHRHPLVRRTEHISGRGLEQKLMMDPASLSSYASGEASTTRNLISASRRNLDDHRKPKGSAASNDATDRALVSSETRYLVFGTSHTYGEGLENPETESYPALLSSNFVQNAATRSGGFTLAAACTQSIVQNSIYDVIIVEFIEWDSSLSLLTRRLKGRFPHAAFVFLRLWRPSQLKFRPPNQVTNTTIDFHAFRKREGGLAMDDPELYIKVLSTKQHWFFDRPRDEEAVLAEVHKHGAFYFAMNLPDNDLFEYPKTLMDQLAIFHENNLNILGHKTVADNLRSIVQQLTLPNAMQAATLGGWVPTDICKLWYETGLYNYHSSNAHNRLRNVQFTKAREKTDSYWNLSGRHADDHKHALEVSNAHGSKLVINNSLGEERMLYLTYLTTRDNDDENTDDHLSLPFPKMRVSINDTPIVMIEAFHERNPRSAEDSHYAEVARTTAVGFVKPGKSTISLDPLTSPLHPTRPFRLLGWSLLPKEAQEQLDLQYGLEESVVPALDH